MGIGASVSSHSSPVTSAHHALSPEHEQEEEDLVENVPTRQKNKFLLFNEKCLERSSYFMKNTTERKIFCKFILQERWRGKLNPELKKLIINQLPQPLWNVEKFNPLAKKISIGETFTDNFLHETNNSTIELFNAPQLQSILIVCCLNSYFQLRSQMDSQSQHDMLSSEFIRQGLLMRSSSINSMNDDDVDDNDGSESKCSMVSMESEEIDQYDKNPEILLSNIANISTELEIDRLLASGVWISHVMTSFSDLKSTISVWDATPNRENTHEIPSAPTIPSLLYCSKRPSIDTDELHVTSSRSTSCMVTFPTRCDSTLSTSTSTTANLYSAPITTTSSPSLPSTSSSQPFTSTFSEPSSGISSPPSSSSHTVLPPSAISAFLLKENVQRAIHNQQVFKTTIQDRETAFIQSSYVVMLPFKYYWKNGPMQYVITIQHPITGSSYDRMMIRMSDLIVFTVGILISI